eukprot:907630-Pleurochrysis_carterae.AAC.2
MTKLERVEAQQQQRLGAVLLEPNADARAASLHPPPLPTPLARAWGKKRSSSSSSRVCSAEGTRAIATGALAARVAAASLSALFCGAAATRSSCASAQRSMPSLARGSCWPSAAAAAAAISEARLSRVDRCCASRASRGSSHVSQPRANRRARWSGRASSAAGEAPHAVGSSASAALKTAASRVARALSRPTAATLAASHATGTAPDAEADALAAASSSDSLPSSGSAPSSTAPSPSPSPSTSPLSGSLAPSASLATSRSSASVAMPSSSSSSNRIGAGDVVDTSCAAHATPAPQLALPACKAPEASLVSSHPAELTAGIDSRADIIRTANASSAVAAVAVVAGVGVAGVRLLLEPPLLSLLSLALFLREPPPLLSGGALFGLDPRARAALLFARLLSATALLALQTLALALQTLALALGVLPPPQPTERDARRRDGHRAKGEHLHTHHGHVARAARSRRDRRTSAEMDAQAEWGGAHGALLPGAGPHLSVGVRDCQRGPWSRPARWCHANRERSRKAQARVRENASARNARAGAQDTHARRESVRT